MRTYTWETFRCTDSNIPPDLIQLGHIYASIHGRPAAAASADQIPIRFRHSDVGRRIVGRLAGFPAAQAVQIPVRAWPLVLLPFGFDEGDEIATEDQQRPLGIDYRQPLLDPLPDSIAMNSVQTRDFINGVVPMDLGEAGIQLAGAHGDRPRYSPSDVDERLRDSIQESRSRES